MIKEDFVKKYLPMATAAGSRYKINPTVILAQAAQESGWGGSYGAKQRNNFFGILAIGRTNEFWKGTKSPSKTNPHLIFRVYATAQDSFFDFARLISTKYQNAALLSQDSTAYAASIAASPYISETNGDNREVYKQNLVSNSNFIDKTIAALRKTGPTIVSLLLLGGIIYLFNK